MSYAMKLIKALAEKEKALAMVENDSLITEDDVISALNDMGAIPDTVSIDTDRDLEQGICDISGIRGLVYPCFASHAESRIKTVNFCVHESLVGGVFGRAVGAF